MKKQQKSTMIVLNPKYLLPHTFYHHLRIPEKIYFIGENLFH